MRSSASVWRDENRPFWILTSILKKSKTNVQALTWVLLHQLPLNASSAGRQTGRDGALRPWGRTQPYISVLMETEVAAMSFWMKLSATLRIWIKGWESIEVWEDLLHSLEETGPIFIKIKLSTQLFLFFWFQALLKCHQKTPPFLHSRWRDVYSPTIF